jgi:serpin B
MLRALIASFLAMLLVATAADAKVAARRRPPLDELAAEANNLFAIALYAQLASDKANADQNLVFSPASIELALDLTYAGAKSDTASQMAAALRFDQIGAQRDVAAGFAMLEKELGAQGKKQGVELRIVDRIWAQKGIRWAKQLADVEQADFVHAAEKVQKTINTWVDKQTKGRIKDLIPDGTLQPTTVMVLVNAIYFKGQWAHKFDKKDTQTEPFTTSTGVKVKTPLMHQIASLGYTQIPGAQVVELPYRQSSLAMDLIVPDDVNGFAEVEKEFTAGTWAFLAQLSPTNDVDLTMPRFQVTLPLSLVDSLTNLGMKVPFDPEQADFSGLLDPKEKDEHQLYISAIVHKAFVLVDEEGSEAAAATAVVMDDAGDAVAPQPPKVRADHPFVWLIRDTKSGAVLFIGRVTDPTK